MPLTNKQTNKQTDFESALFNHPPLKSTKKWPESGFFGTPWSLDMLLYVGSLGEWAGSDHPVAASQRYAVAAGDTTLLPCLSPPLPTALRQLLILIILPFPCFIISNVFMLSAQLDERLLPLKQNI